jgi:HEAT repeat protein
MQSLAARGLKEAGPAALSVLPELLKRLRERTESVVRACLVDAITAMGPEASSAVPDIVALLDGAMTPELSRVVFMALQTFPAAVLPFVPRLTEMLRQPEHASLHGQIADLLTALIPHGVNAFSAFRELLRQALAGEMYRHFDLTGAFRFDVARAGVKGLIALGSAATEALPDLMLAYQTFGNSEVRDMREKILEAYGVIGPLAVPHILPALSDSIWKIRFAAIDALGQTGDTSADTMDALRKGEMDASQKVRTLASNILRKMDGTKRKRN